MNNLAIIPARGGSVRIPQKNIKDFFGKPIIAYSIEAAIKSRLFSEVMVSTDDNEIAEIAKKYGAKIPFLRSSINSDDRATLSQVVTEVVNQYQNQGRTFDYYCCILATSPLLQIKNLDQGFKLLKSSTFQSIRPLIRFNYPTQRALRFTDGAVEFMYPEYKLSRSQDLEPTFHDAAQFYWMRKEGLLESDDKGGFEISSIEAQDIDNKIDWNIAEMKFKYLFNRDK